MRLVLDTNVWLDWLVFDGNEVAGLKQARQDKVVEFVIDAACLDELRRVLAYPEFSLGEAAIAVNLARIAELAVFFNGTGDGAALPRCSDPDDQKFLQLARAAKADLITRDKALLKLGRRTRRSCGFSISAPRDWVAAPTSSTHRLHHQNTQRPQST
ncbi:MAG TPA: putative toxin-antitoxin system toxin component, PIN family [Burkholderiales bacterium]|nr:putative toxin-antitoxin system toxin component, PIN family [Burkholderiales bacterium]